MADWNDRYSNDFNAFDANSNGASASDWFGGNVGERSNDAPRIVARLPFLEREGRSPSRAKKSWKRFWTQKIAFFGCAFALGAVSCYLAERAFSGASLNASVADDQNSAIESELEGALKSGISAEPTSSRFAFDLMDVSSDDAYGTIYDIDPPLTAPNDERAAGVSVQENVRSVGVADAERGRLADSAFPSWSDLESSERTSARAYGNGLVDPSLVAAGEERASFDDAAPYKTTASNEIGRPSASQGFSDYASFPNAAAESAIANNDVRPQSESVAVGSYANAAPSYSAAENSQFVGFHLQAPGDERFADAVDNARSTETASNDFIPTFDAPNPPSPNERPAYVAQRPEETPRESAPHPYESIVPQRNLRW